MYTMLITETQPRKYIQVCTLSKQGKAMINPRRLPINLNISLSLSLEVVIA